MKLCKDCRHFHESCWCHHPNNGVSLLDGKSESEFCLAKRKDENACGQDGKWFEPIEITTKRKWWKLWLKR